MNSSSSLPCIDRHDHLDVATFIDAYLRPNKPVVIGPALIRYWPVFTRWLTATTPAKPAFDWLNAQFGQTTVTVTECPGLQSTGEEEQAWPTRKMPLNQFIACWQDDSTDSGASHLYLKDWHFQRTFPHEPLYTPPDLFADDWLNRYWDQRKDVDDDYRFVYMGGNGTWTPLHTDVFQSFSWSANICGRKRWTLFPPTEKRHLMDQHEQLVPDIRCVDTRRFPTFKQARSIVFIQEPGETFFVPTGWYHQVENIGHTISINHNWLNAANLFPLYQCLQSDLEQVRYALRDCVDMDDFDNHCQVILRANSAWHYEDFAQMLIMACYRFIPSINRNTSSIATWDDQVSWRPSDQLCQAEIHMQSFTIAEIARVINDIVQQQKQQTTSLITNETTLAELIHLQTILNNSNSNNNNVV